MSKHSPCSPSSSFRWTKCTRSARINAEADDRGSLYAQQGTDAHSLCEHLVKKALGRKSRDPTENLTWYDQEMQESAEGYRDFVVDAIEEIKKSCPNPYIGVEQRLDFSDWVPEGYGTGDCIIVADEIAHIIDFKYGIGLPVKATENTQLMCYGLGILETFGNLYNIKRIRLSIYQPRRENVDTWEISTEDLLKWADDVLKPAAELAYAGEGEFKAGEHCIFCRIKDTCRERADYYMDLMKHELEDPAELTDDEIVLILPKVEGLVGWATDLKEYVLQQALNGRKYKGFKVVEGRATRKYTDEAIVADVVEKAGYDPYEKKVLGITAMTKELGKKKFEELLGGLVYKPKGKPVLVSDDDKRPEYSNVTIDDLNDK